MEYVHGISNVRQHCTFIISFLLNTLQITAAFSSEHRFHVVHVKVLGNYKVVFVSFDVQHHTILQTNYL